jgi:hypothetical protein
VLRIASWDPGVAGGPVLVAFTIGVTNARTEGFNRIG